MEDKTIRTERRNTPERIEGIKAVVRRFADNSHMASYSHQRDRDRESAYAFIDTKVDDESTRQELRDYYETHAFKEEAEKTE